MICATSAMAQKLPCSIDEINAVLDEYDKPITSLSQYLLMDVNDDGVKDIIVRDCDKTYASYAVLLCKDGKLEMEHFAYDGYETLGVAKGGYSVYMHDDHGGPSGRTLDTSFTLYKKGKAALKGNQISTMYYEGEDGEETDESSYSINDKKTDEKTFHKYYPNDVTWFYEITEGWRMVKNNQKVTYYSSEDYYCYDGEIGSYPVMLYFERDKCNGFYFYKSRPESLFTLKCESRKKNADNDENIVVKEFLPDGKQTGTFTGTYRQGSSFSGTFVNSTNQSFEFSLYYR